MHLYRLTIRSNPGGFGSGAATEEWIGTRPFGEAGFGTILRVAAQE